MLRGWRFNFVICREQMFTQKMTSHILPEIAGNVFRSSIPKQNFPVSVH